MDETIIDQSKTIVFWMFPAVSHYYPTFELARAFKQEGISVVYACSEKYERLVTSNGFESYVLKRQDDIELMSTTLKADAERHSGFMAIISAWKCNSQLNQVIISQDFFANMLTEVKPSLILVDVFHQHHTLHLQKHKVPYCHIDVYVSPSKGNNKPPYTSSFVPLPTKVSQIRSSFTWTMYFLRKSIDPFLHPTVNKTIKALAKKYNYPGTAIDWQSMHGFSFTKIDKIMTSWRQFDFPGAVEKNVYYFSPSKALMRSESGYDPRFDKIKDVLSQSGQKTVLCNFGTVSVVDNRLALFFQRLIQAFGEMTHYNLILSIEDEVLRLKLRNTAPDNVFVFKTVPQLYVLNHLADVMITHGGINSITECIFSNTPMLVFPISKKSDQHGNAARVVYHGLGKKGRFGYSLNHLMTEIHDLVENVTYRKSISEFLSQASEDSQKQNGLTLQHLMQLIAS